MKTKEEVIKEAYGSHYLEYRHLIDDNGGIIINWSVAFYNMDKSPNNDLVVDLVHDKIECYVNESGYILPKSLIGIENNNGWIKIESVSDLPKEVDFTVFHTIQDGSIRQSDWWGKDAERAHYWINNITHYKPIVKPLNPLY